MTPRLLPFALLLLLGCPGDFTDEDEDGYAPESEGGADCDDGDASIHPGQEETCDDVDQDCDGLVDEDPVDGNEYFEDRDLDGHGNSASTTSACQLPYGYAEAGGDCDDLDADRYPGATEDDCTDPVDYNCDNSVGYANVDGDGYAACRDCDDNDWDVYPGAEETCNDTDDDCDGLVDEDATGATTWYLDHDGDGYGDTDQTTVACDQPENYDADSGDCDDLDPSSYPGGTEVCDGADNDCNTITDDVSTPPTWYLDDDDDGYGDPLDSTTGCNQPSDYVANDDDCADDDATSFPGANEICHDSADNDCDLSVDEDCLEDCDDGDDNDGDSLVDCEDGDCFLAAVCIEDECGDQADNDADGLTDCDDSDCWVTSRCQHGVKVRVTGGQIQITSSYGSSFSTTCDGSTSSDDWNSYQRESTIYGTIRVLQAPQLNWGLATDWVTCDWTLWGESASITSSYVQSGCGFTTEELPFLPKSLVRSGYRAWIPINSTIWYTGSTVSSNGWGTDDSGGSLCTGTSPATTSDYWYTYSSGWTLTYEFDTGETYTWVP
jgi:hypothetical protein